MRRSVKFLLVLLVVLAPLPAFADSFSLNIQGCTNCSSGGIPPYGAVTLTQNGSSVNVSVSLVAGVYFVGTGFPATFAFNLTTNPTVTFSNLTAGYNAFATTATPQGPQGIAMDGLGAFDYGIVCTICQGGSNPQSPPLSFDVTATGGLTIADFIELSTNPPGGQGAYFAVDIINTNATGTGATGIVGSNCTNCGGGGGSGNPVPEPSTLLLLGTVLSGLAFWRRKQSK